MTPMAIDFSAIGMSAAIFATILTPLLTYLNQASQTYFLDLLAVPFALFLIAAVTEAIWQGDVTVVLFVLGVIVEIVLYVMMALEQYYFQKSKLT